MRPIATPMLGEILMAEGSISSDARDDALKLSPQGAKFGQALLNNGDCNNLTLHRAIAKQRNLPFLNLLRNPPHRELLQLESLQEYLSLQLVPHSVSAEGDTLLAGVEFKEAQREWAETHYPNHQFVQTSPLDISRALNAAFPDELSDHSINGLAKRSPVTSARTLFNRQSHIPLIVMLAICFSGLLLAPTPFLAGFLLILSLFHLVTLGFKSLLFYQGARYRTQLWNQHLDKPALKDTALPTYSILIPLYREANILPQLLDAIRALDYPKHLLDVKLIIEEDDAESYAAAIAEKPEGYFEIIRVPYSQPRTKPKACNYALQFARGDIITIYDAEDRPHPQQLRDVVHRFFYGAKELVCVQCRLNYYNRSANVLTKLFAIEYAAWFDFMIPGLNRWQLPIPLGGTSNHIYRKKLIELGEWDPFNVTEDADLGIRLAAFRYQTEIIQSQTLEESPMYLWPWLKQRSRWIKGYMQTWLVYMRRPLWLWKTVGARCFFAFQLFIGGPCMVFISTPILLSLSVIWLIYPQLWSEEITRILLPLSLATLLYGVTLHLIFALETVRMRQWSGMRLAVMLFPFYWLLHSIASFRALSQLITRPHYWEKTEHGLWQKMTTKPLDN